MQIHLSKRSATLGLVRASGVAYYSCQTEDTSCQGGHKSSSLAKIGADLSGHGPCESWFSSHWFTADTQTLLLAAEEGRCFPSAFVLLAFPSSVPNTSDTLLKSEGFCDRHEH